MQRVPERLPEVAVEVCVDQRIKRGVGVADPEQKRNDDVRRSARIAAQRGRQIPTNYRNQLVSWRLVVMNGRQANYLFVYTHHVKKGSQHAMNVPGNTRARTARENEW